MPNYDYRCLDCRKRFEIYLTYQEYGRLPVHCKHCGSENVIRRVGRVRVLRSEESRLESFGDMDDLAGLEDNPRELGRMMRKMSAETGEDLGPEFNEVIGRLEAGQSPEEIEKTLPDIAGGDEDFGGGAGFGVDDF